LRADGRPVAVGEHVAGEHVVLGDAHERQRGRRRPAGAALARRAMKERRLAGVVEDFAKQPPVGARALGRETI
jgi:hypothetical protein